MANPPTDGFYSEQGFELPSDVKLLARNSGGNGDDPTAYALSDVTANDVFARTWLVLVGSNLVVVDPGDAAGIRTLSLDVESAVSIVEGRGKSRLRIARQGKLEEEFHYTRRQARRFSELEQHCSAVITGEPQPRFQSGSREEAVPADERICRKCNQLMPEWADSCPRCLQKRKIILRLVGYAKPYKTSAAIGMVAASLLSLLMLVPPVLTKHLIDDVLAPLDFSRLGWMYALLGMLAAVILARVVCTHFRLKYLAVVGERIAHDLRTEAYGHLHKLSLSFFNKKPTGQLISRISHDTDRLWDFIAFGLIEILMSLVTILGVCVVMFWTAPTLAVLTLIPIPIGIIMTYYHTVRMRRFFHRIWRKWSRMTATLSDAIPGIRVVKAFTQEDREVSKFNSRSKDVLDEAVRLHHEWTGYWPKITLLLQMGNLIIWAYAGPRILQQEFTLGTFVMFSSLIWMFYGPVEQLGMMNRLLQRAATSAQRVFEIIDTPLTIYTPTNPVAAPKIEGRITFESVSFSYDGVKPTLTDVSFDVKPGEMIGLVGPSGSGKTTLVNIICRFYDVSRGRILIDGVDVRDLDLHEMRSQVGMVLQEPYLFSGTILANISYGNDKADTDDIIRAAKAAHAHDFVVGFPDGYDTMVGERGQTLSGGERQRISIARAILNNPRILILDEATSSVDTETEMKIQEAIRHLVKGRTTVAIAHRLSTLQAADRLMVLEKGKLVQLDTYDELINDKDGLYARLHKTQTELQSIFAV